MTEEEVRALVERKRAEALERRQLYLANKAASDENQQPIVGRPTEQACAPPNKTLSTLGYLSSQRPPAINGVHQAPITSGQHFGRPTANGPTHKSSTTVNPQSGLPASRIHEQLTRSTPLKEVKVSLSVMNHQEIRVDFPYAQEIIDAFSKLPKDLKTYHANQKFWSCNFKAYTQLKAELAAVRGVAIILEDLPTGVRKLFANEIAGKREELFESIDPPIQPNSSNSSTGIMGVPESLTSQLFPFQRGGILFGIKKQGRVLIADEMGLGKSVQALGVALYFQKEWPLLIVCPASVRHAWRTQLQKFVPLIPSESIHIIEKTRDQLPPVRSTSTVIIISYDMMTRMKKAFVDYSFYTIIFDESHMLKTKTTARSKLADELAKKASRVILLSGTPAPSCPAELYWQIHLLNRSLFPSFDEFAMRYCQAFYSEYGLQARGACHTDELNTILEKSLLIRRLKKDVLAQLPEKRRELVLLRGDSIDHKMQELVEAREGCKHLEKLNINDRRNALMQYYHETAVVKADSVAEYIVDTYFYQEAALRKIIIFAHHQIVMDKISDLLTKKDVKFIRIDGRTTNRAELCAKFQEVAEYQVALLSITAAGTGITLTAANRVVFAELNWNPMIMMQAEDRAHRLGQKNSVLVQYMLAKNTADDNMWLVLEKKLNVLAKVNLSGSDDYKTAEKAHRDLSNQLITKHFSSLADASLDTIKEDRENNHEVEVMVDDEECEVISTTIGSKVNGETAVSPHKEVEIVFID